MQLHLGLWVNIPETKLSSGDPTYFSVQTISLEIFGELLHVARKTPESIHLGVKDFQEAAAQVVHSLGITDLWFNNKDNRQTDTNNESQEHSL